MDYRDTVAIPKLSMSTIGIGENKSAYCGEQASDQELIHNDLWGSGTVAVHTTERTGWFGVDSNAVPSSLFREKADLRSPAGQNDGGCGRIDNEIVEAKQKKKPQFLAAFILSSSPKSLLFSESWHP